ncbi:AAA family ATPase [Anaerotalea alkaliphila]|uniref:Nuclease SbcCD subunit C n=1 Tax=Anaerotalea alkaliphila TaxID=2662126 RepID=A0A7X5HX43_9FIRM|nr:AAA family ATPase [Anaerotalea alkaliphila]NDL68262.1 AAA family ATPase [Anaerotalea alkaliphila]
MRPLRLEMSAFGPYAKVQTIDFTELSDRRLFLVTGPTGAGKTTIFDAISYALYGESSGDLRTAEGLRSHFAREGDLTKVTLEFSLRGKTYRVERVPRQTKKKTRGEGFTEQAPTAELVLLEGEEAPARVVVGISEVNAKVEEVIGLNAQQFKQIMMIPQGEFRKLLTASSKDREQVLNKLFDTELYGMVQRQLEEERKKTANELDGIKERRSYVLDKIKVPDGEHPLARMLELSDKNMAAILEELDRLLGEDSQALGVLQGEVQALERKRTRELEARAGAQAMNEKIARHRILEESLKAHLEGAEGNRRREEVLDLGRKAWQVRPLEEALLERARERDGKATALDRTRTAWESARKSLEEAEEGVQKAKSPEQARKREDRKSLLQNLRSMVEKAGKLEALREKLELLDGKLEALRKRQLLEEEQRKEEGLALDKALAQRETLDGADEALMRTREAYKEGKDRLNLLAKALLQLEEAAGREKPLEAAQARVRVLEKDWQEAARNLQALQRDYHLNQAALLAKELASGMPCPVCGSLEHPAPAQAVSRIVEASDLEAGEELRAKAQQRHQAALDARRDLKAERETFLAQGLALLEELGPEFTGRTRTWLAEEQKSRSAALQGLEQAGKTLLAQVELRKKLDLDIKGMGERKASWERESRQAAEEEKRLLGDWNLLQGQKDALEQDVPVQWREKGPLLQEIGTLEETVRKEEEHLVELEHLRDKEKETATGLQASLGALEETLASLARTLEEGERKFKEALEEKGFPGVEAYRAAAMEPEAMERLEEEIRNHQTTGIRLNQSLADSSREIQGAAPIPLEGFDSAIRLLEERRDSLQTSLGQTRGRLEDNTKTREELLEIRRSLETLEESYGVVGRLAAVANGRNQKNITFERYVLAALLADIVEAANLRLSKMTGNRYQLRRADAVEDKRKQAGLDLEVFDEYTGRARPVRTLSGGETFKASLAMALGLSDVVQSYAGGVQLDTMFIDEGFGTLDPESLDQAISCLIDLQKMGRMIGIISHVPELKERIDARLEVDGDPTGSHARFVL